jgi:hypothetical protein
VTGSSGTPVALWWKIKTEQIMKNVFLALTFTIFATAAHAQEENISCYSRDVADAGFTFQVSEDRETALLSEQSIAGPKALAELSCQGLFHTMVFQPDAIYTTLLCRDEKSGYIVRVREGGIYFRREAVVTKAVSQNGKLTEQALEFGHLDCPLKPRQ